MATSISVIRFSPHCLSRPNTSRNPPNKPIPQNLPSKHSKKHKTTTTTTSVSGGDNATTFTRLPPKEDFILSLPSSFQSRPPQIKLSDSEVVEPKTHLKNDELIEKDEEIGESSGFVYEKFELFEGNPDSENEDDEDENVFNPKIEQKNDQLRRGNKQFYGKLGLNSENVELFEVNSDLDYENDKDLDDNNGRDEFLGLRVEGFEEGEEAGEKEKEKGVPAVMRCFDRAKIYVKSGDGGNGVVAFRREKYVPFGGPSGGDGGRGGNVYMEVDETMNSLLPFRQSVHFRAGRGEHGQGKKQSGAKGEDLVVKVPPGTVVKEAGRNGVQGNVLLELLRGREKALLLPGGRGGRGNASFKSGTNKVPKIAENGEEGPEMWLELELKLVADVGIVGAPNAGKSTFLSAVSAAQPNIANYPFTTLLPNLGVVSFDYDATMVVADLPGLLEGAHRGFGLGHEFLRHAERCSVLVHVVDGSSQQPDYEFDAVRLELEMFNPELAQKPYLVAYNKMDLPEAYENWMSFKERLCACGIEPFGMSALRREGAQEVICAAYELVRNRLEAKKEESWNAPLNLNHVADMVRKQQIAPINEFDISHDSTSNTWHVDGAGLQRFVQMTNWSYIDSERRFQHVLEACGVYKSLAKLGVKEGATVIVGEMELVWHDSLENSHPASMRKWSAAT